jgi:isopentenyl diphosphate isomerase/L-lactate dehydrogenase-like FMN-dependent dehydrogenase
VWTGNFEDVSRRWPAAGEHGVREVIQNVLAEFDLTMALTGCATL